MLGLPRLWANSVGFGETANAQSVDIQVLHIFLENTCCHPNLSYLLSSEFKLPFNEMFNSFYFEYKLIVKYNLSKDAYSYFIKYVLPA